MLKNTFKKLRSYALKSAGPKVTKHDFLIWYNIESFQEFCFKLAQLMFQTEEEIPSFETRYKGVLESCLKQPLQSFEDGDCYPTALDKIAMMYYMLIKNHPFQNGNKRIATVALLVFCWSNDLNIDPTNEQIKRLALTIAKSNPKDREKIIIKIKKYVKKYIKKDFKIDRPKTLEEIVKKLQG